MSQYKKNLRRGATREERAAHFVERAKQIHGKEYDYSLVPTTFVRQQVLVSIICKKHGVFEQLPTNHLAGKGCIKCSKEKINAIRYKTQYKLAKENQKICGSCNKVLPFTDFTPEPSGRKIGKVAAWCKDCCKNKNKTQYKKRIKEYNLKKYGLSLEDYDALLQAQNYKCRICDINAESAPGVGSSKGGVLCVDHDHLTNKIRGLLCSRCNAGLGLFFDDISNLEKAILYLKENS